MLFFGIDLHSNNSVVVISDENDKVLYSKRHPNNLEEICAALSPYRADLFGVVVESTFNWYWLVDGLQDADYSVHLANTTAIKLRYCEAAKKFYQRKKAKRNGIVAIKAVAHKLARACFHMLKTGEVFSVERCFT